MLVWASIRQLNGLRSDPSRRPFSEAPPEIAHPL
jgi:hypothetical protein